MSNFQGIAPDGMFLLAENRFHDSKSYYEEHKPQIKAQVLDPLRSLAEDLAGTMIAIDPRIVTDPNRNGCVSRVRRDNRYTRDKSLYRENMWVGFMRDKKAYECAPGFFVDISLKGSTYGMGFYYTTPRLMQTVRRMIDENPAAWTKALKRAQAAGFVLAGDRYARPKKEGLPRCSTRYTTARPSRWNDSSRTRPFSAPPLWWMSSRRLLPPSSLSTGS